MCSSPYDIPPSSSVRLISPTSSFNSSVEVSPPINRHRMLFILHHALSPWRSKLLCLHLGHRVCLILWPIVPRRRTILISIHLCASWIGLMLLNPPLQFVVLCSPTLPLQLLLHPPVLWTCLSVLIYLLPLLPLGSRSVPVIRHRSADY